MTIHSVVLFSLDQSAGSTDRQSIPWSQATSMAKKYLEKKKKIVDYKGDRVVVVGVSGEPDRGNGWAFVGLLVLGSVRVKRDCKNASRNRQQQDVWLLKESSQVHTCKAAHARTHARTHAHTHAHVPMHSENADCMQMGRRITLSNQTLHSLPPFPPTAGWPRASSPQHCG